MGFDIFIFVLFSLILFYYLWWKVKNAFQFKDEIE